MTGSPQTEPEWLVEGGAVLVRVGRSRVERDRIARLTKRDVVLVSGSRFNRDRRSRRSADPWSATDYLLAPDDAAALAQLRDQQSRARLSRLERDLRGITQRQGSLDITAVQVLLSTALADLKLEASDDRG
jgi:hypothetical protein